MAGLSDAARTSPSINTSKEHNNEPPPTTRPSISSPQVPVRVIPGINDATDAELRLAATSSLHRSSLLLRQQTLTDPTLFHTGSRSLASIALHGFVLGAVLSASLLCIILLPTISSGSSSAPPNPWPAPPEDSTTTVQRWWRLPAFLAALALFHFLEFYTTARWNTPTAKVGSFLVFSNGAAYNAAYAAGLLEIALAAWLAPGWQARVSPTWSVASGLGLVVLGQGVRSAAMATAGTNFNHVPVKRKAEGHVLVTRGVYRWLRHPSYFGFFWWAVGTQVLVGNAVCTVVYAVVLWGFFNKRIEGEERFLVEFFGDDYRAYRARTRTWIPFIR